MTSVKHVLQSRAVLSGHAIEVDFQLDDGSKTTLQIPYAQIPQLLRKVWDAAATAETIQRQAAGERMEAFVAPYQARAVTVGSSQDGTILADFSTAQGPMQISMGMDLARSTIAQLSTAVADIAQRTPRRLS